MDCEIKGYTKSTLLKELNIDMLGCVGAKQKITNFVLDSATGIIGHLSAEYCSPLVAKLHGKSAEELQENRAYIGSEADAIFSTYCAVQSAVVLLAALSEAVTFATTDEDMLAHAFMSALERQSEISNADLEIFASIVVANTLRIIQAANADG